MAGSLDFCPYCFISGGQTGADRAALDFALARNLPVRGFCPRGRRANDGPLPDHYPLQETSSIGYPVRTRRNVELAAATVIFDGIKGGSSGTRLAVRHARATGKIYKILKGFPSIDQDVDALQSWLRELRPTTLNVAGNAEETCPGMYAHVQEVLRRTFD